MKVVDRRVNKDKLKITLDVQRDHYADSSSMNKEENFSLIDLQVKTSSLNSKSTKLKQIVSGHNTKIVLTVDAVKFELTKEDDIDILYAAFEAQKAKDNALNTKLTRNKTMFPWFKKKPKVRSENNSKLAEDLKKLMVYCQGISGGINLEKIKKSCTLAKIQKKEFDKAVNMAYFNDCLNYYNISSMHY